MPDTTRLDLPYPSSSSPVAVHTDIQALADRLDLIATPTLVTSMPGSPTDGDEVFLQTAAMATAGLCWHFRYEASASSAHKWEFLGGGSYIAESTFADTGTIVVSTTPTFARTLTGAAAVTVMPFFAAGEYEAELIAGFTSPNGAAKTYVGVANSAETLSAIPLSITDVAASSSEGQAFVRKVSVAASQTIGPVYGGVVSAGTATVTYQYLCLRVRPIRVS